MGARREVGRTVAVPVRGEVLEPKSGAEFVARPIASAPVPYVPLAEQQVRILLEQVPGQGAPEAAKVSKVVPWTLVAVALCVLLFALYAAWHTMAGPVIKPGRSQQSIDLVSPSR